MEARALLGPPLERAQTAAETAGLDIVVVALVRMGRNGMGAMVVVAVVQGITRLVAVAETMGAEADSKR